MNNLNYSRMVTSNNVCHNCPKRDIYCHEYCKDYISWKKKLDEKNVEIHEEGNELREICSYYKKVDNPYFY